jgi:hypothetical protein
VTPVLHVLLFVVAPLLVTLAEARRPGRAQDRLRLAAVLVFYGAAIPLGVVWYGLAGLAACGLGWWLTTRGTR